MSISRQALAMFCVNGITLFSFCAAQDEVLKPVRPHDEFAAKKDPRLGPLRDLNGYFPFTVPKSLDSWEKRKGHLQSQLKTSLGLNPFPKRTPLNAVIHGNIDKGDYTIEKVYFESLPGFYVTGNLYRPKNIQGKIPVVLSPHGHHRDGRFREASENEIDAEIKAGAEKFRPNAKSPLQARCVHLARMGCTVFHYDMIGYADSVQLSYELAHRFADQREHMNGKERWGFFSPQAEMRLQSIMGLQTWNSIRVLDFVESLPEADTNRIGVTGASGGGTQSFILCAIDPRPAVCFPAVMVSTAMQGGCTCENCCNLRTVTGNVEIAALFAPKPMGLSAANDWTKEMTTKGFPELQKLYSMYDAPENVYLISRTEFGHNYNQVCREAMYRWFNKHLKLNGSVNESPIEFVSPKELSVWDDEHPRPRGGEEVEISILKTLNKFADPAGNKATVEKFREVARICLPHLLNLTEDAFEQIEFYRTAELFAGDTIVFDALTGERNPILPISPKKPKAIVVAVGNKGIGGRPLHTPGQHSEFTQSMFNNGIGAVGLDLVFQGEFIDDGEKITEARWVSNPRQAAGYTFGYNSTLFAHRVKDVMRLVKGLKRERKVPIYLISTDETASIAIVAAAAMPDDVAGLVAGLNGFRFSQVKRLRDPYFFPGAIKYGDMPGLLMLAPKMPMLIGGESVDSLSFKVGDVTLSSPAIEVSDLTGKKFQNKAAEWILQQMKK